MKYLQKLGLLILLGSLLECTTNTSDHKGQTSAYIPNLAKLHGEIRAKIKPFNDSISYFSDTAEFFSRVHPVLLSTDMLVGKQAELRPINRKDSLAYAASQRLNLNYQNLLHLGYLDLFEIYNKKENSKLLESKADSIMHYFMNEDTLAVNYFNTMLQDSSSRLKFLK